VPYAGEQLGAADVAGRLHRLGFRDLDLVEMLATLMGESNLYTEAWNDNLAEAGAALKRGDKVLIQGDLLANVYTVTRVGAVHIWLGNRPEERGNLRKVLSRDVGLGQINIPARDIGTQRELDLRDPDKNLRAVRALFDTRETLVRRRRFNPWYAYTKGWATFPEWWVFSTREQAEATGAPRHWKPTGRYIHKAIVGVANFHAQRLGIASLVALPDEPPKPTKRPVGDGPRPEPNKGRGSLG